jgi:hypothetical protein
LRKVVCLHQTARPQPEFSTIGHPVVVSVELGADGESGRQRGHAWSQVAASSLVIMTAALNGE